MDLEALELLLLALAPVVFLFTYVYLADKYEREPLVYLIITFVLGLVIAYPVILIGDFLRDFTQVSSESTSWIELAVYAFFVVALSEEGMKYLVLRWYNFRHDEFDEPYDGIVYGVAVSLGFAAIENVFYVFDSETNGMEVGIMRMFTAVPAHAMFGVMMGYFVGKSKFCEKSGVAAMWMRTKGLLVAMFYHGLYDFL